MAGECLPDHLKDRLHDDYIWPFCYIPRRWTSFCWKQPPKLLFGIGVTRWVTVGDESWLFTPGEEKRIFFLGHPYAPYGPSPLQKLSPWSFQITWPFHVAFHVFLGKRPLFVRFGARWDSLDRYYTFPSFFIGLAWN